MKSKLKIIGIFTLLCFTAAPFAFSQTNAQLNSDSTFTDMNDTSEYHSEAYYNYAKKNIIEDKTPDDEYQGKWVDSSKTETSESENDEWNKSGNSMNNQNEQMNKMKNDSTGNMNKMKNDAEKKTNDMKNDTEKKTDDMNQNSQNK